jgi:putative endopeptidase
MLKKNIPALLLFISLLGSGICFSQTNAKKQLPAKPVYIDKNNMDLSVKPGDNFYLYADGNWIKNNPVPASRVRWGNFDELRQENSKRLSLLLDEASKNTGRDRKTQIIGDFYHSGMDSITIEKKGYDPIKSGLLEIENLKSVPDVLKEAAKLRVDGGGGIGFRIFVSPDKKNALVYIPSIGQGGTSLPDRDYYLKDDSRSLHIRDAYTKNINTLFSLTGESEMAAANDATTILKIETILAQAQYSRVEMRDPYKTYNKFSIKDLSATTPNINWATVLNDYEIKGADSIVVNNPSFFKTFDSLLTTIPLNEWKTYLRWNIIRNAAPYLSSPFVNADFEFNKAMTGQKQPTPRYERVSGLIDQLLGDLLGQLYVEKYFKPEAKVYMVNMVDNIESTFAERIKRLDWMSDETKQKALQKLKAITKKICYPDKWKDYEGVVIHKDDFVGNIRSASEWAYNYMVNHMGKPVDKTDWGMTTPTINAQYSSSNNDITFPAGILQFPFFDFGADDAVNYGGIAAVIGHEMTHGFDDQGRKFDANGNLKDWWKKQDEDKFKLSADKVAKQFNDYTVLDTLHINGDLTLGENLADLGGLNIAYEAFTKTKEFKEGKKINGFTPQQRFFLSWAQVWRSNTLPESEAQLVKTDPHSPGMYRTNGPVSNIDAWYAAFDVTPREKMYKPESERIRIW